VTLNTAVPARPRTKVRANARGCDGGIRKELAAGVVLSLRSPLSGGQHLLVLSFSAFDPEPDMSTVHRAGVFRGVHREQGDPRGITFSFDFDVRESSDGPEHY
jgi:hypothetical protein